MNHITSARIRGILRKKTFGKGDVLGVLAFCGRFGIGQPGLTGSKASHVLGIQEAQLQLRPQNLT